MIKTLLLVNKYDVLINIKFSTIPELQIKMI